MKITRISYQVKNPERANVYIDGTYAFSLSVSQVIEQKLKSGVEIDKERRQHLEDLSFDGKLYAKALNWAFLRPRSTQELKVYLARQLFMAKKDLSSEQKSRKISQITEELIRRNYVDDELFSKWWLERPSSSKKSSRALKAELRSKGIGTEIIDAQLSSTDESAALTNLIGKLSQKPRYKDRQKLMAYLASKGYSYSSITEALAGGATGDNAGN